MKRDSRSVLARVLAGDVRAAERRHVKLMENAEGLPARPFLGGTSLDVDRALTDLVAEGVSWFADRGTIPYAVPIEVTP